MERNPAQFIFSDVKLIMQKIRENMRPIYKDFIAKYLHKVTTEVVGGKNVSFICFEDLKYDINVIFKTFYWKVLLQGLILFLISEIWL